MLFTPFSDSSICTAATGPSSIASTTTTTTVTTTTTTTATSSFTLNLKPLTSIGINNTVPFTPTVNAIITPVMTYGQLDGLVNKWNLELEDQEKYFLHQATLVNAWDYTLMENGEKRSEKVKLHQKRLEQELDFILSQQRELEDLFIPLEESLKDHSGSVYPQYIDEHEKTSSGSAEF
uniref:Nucleoporin 62 C-terminal like n=2 Tax=Bos TaxID=9903 RepID=A0AAA9RWW7_BOVIN